MPPSSPLFRVGLAGWGLAGRYFHAPFIQQVPGLDLVAVVTSRQPDPQRFPGLRVLPTFEALLAEPDLDLLVIATPNHLHQQQAAAALAAGKHVVVEKPVVPTVAAMQELIHQAQAADRLLVPFQNRRWDGDFLTVQRLLDDDRHGDRRGDRLGPLHFYAAHWPKYRPRPRPRSGWKAEPGALSGVFYDLGPHLIDQVIVLFGAPQSVYASVATRRPGGASHDYFRLNLRYQTAQAAPLEVLLEVDMLNPFPRPRFALRGRDGSFEKAGLDPQEEDLRNGAMPPITPDANWGREEPGQWGRLQLVAAPGETELVPTLPGDYGHFYRQLYQALCGIAPPPVDPGDVLLQLQIIEAALTSSRSGEAIFLPSTPSRDI